MPDAEQEIEEITAESTAREIKSGYTGAQTRHALETVMLAWVFGAAFFSIVAGGVFASFVKQYLKTNDVEYGIIFAAGPAAMIFQFIGSYYAERVRRIKRTFIIFVTLHRLLWLAVAAVPLFMQGAPRFAQVAAVAAIVFLSTASGNFGGAGWVAWIARIVPTAIAGRYFGMRARIGLLSMALVGLGGGILIDWQQKSGFIFGLVFAVAALLGAIDILLFIRVPEKPPENHQDPPSLLEIFILPWRNPIFRRYALYIAVSWIAYMMMGPFVWNFCFDMGLPTWLAIIFLTVIPQLSMAFISPLWGKALDRFGPKPVLAASALCQIIIPAGWVLMRGEWQWFIPFITFIGGITWPGIDQVFLYMQVKGFPDHCRTTYIAASNVVLGVACMIGPFIGGLIASFWESALPQIPHVPAWVTHYQPLFMMAILLRLASFLFLFPDIPGEGGSSTVARSILGDVSATVPRIRGTRRARR